MTDNVPAWFRHWIQEQGSNISHWWLKVAVQGPRLKARRFQKYAVNGYKFRVADSGTTKLKEGSGVSVLGEDDDGNETAWYGNLIDIIELIYSKEPLLTIVLFKCRWFALNRMVNFIEHGLTLVDKKRMCDPDYEPYILAQNALLVYYTSIPGSSNVPRRKDMLAVCKVKPTSQIDSNEIEAAFQEEPPAPAQNIPLVELETEDIELGDPSTSEMVLNDPEDNNDRDPQDNESDDINDEDEDQIMLELEDEDSDEE